MPELRVRRLGYALGAEVAGLDLTRPLDPSTVEEVRRLWLTHLMLCFPGSHIEPEHMLRFAEQFGELDDNRRNPSFRHPSYDTIVLVTNQPVGGKKWNGYRNGADWHSDLSFTDHPTTATFLLGKVIPEVGGDTLFANLYGAYESLSPAMHRTLAPLGGVHDVAAAKGIGQRDPVAAATVKQMNPPIVHPVVQVHPETGRKALFVTERMRCFEGMTEEESRPLLDFLTAHAVRYENTYRHVWKKNDLILWDNRCLLHIALADFDMWNDPRQLIRCSLRGPRSGRFYVEENAAREAVAT